jgi:hypothetical protein
MCYRKFEEYALESPEGAARMRSEYVRAYGLVIYCRRSVRYPGVIVLANIKASTERKGYLTRFLKEWSPKLPLEVEHPHNPHLKAFLQRLGWRSVEIWGDVHMYNEKACEIIDARG